MAATDEEREAYEARRSAYWGRTALYRLFDRAEDLLYVGIAMKPESRWEQHAREKHWWPEVGGKTVEWFSDRMGARSAEQVAIQTESPKYNGTHRRAGAPLAPARRHGDGGYVTETSSMRVSVESFSMGAALANFTWAKEMAMNSRAELGELPITYLTNRGVRTLAIIPAWLGEYIASHADEVLASIQAIES